MNTLAGLAGSQDTAEQLFPMGPIHSLDSSRTLLGLMALAKRAEHDHLLAPETETLDGLISRRLLRTMLAALQLRDPLTVLHSRRVALLAAGLGRHLGWEGRPLKALELAGLLHDVGKIGVPDSVLFKPAKLHTSEVELMALHGRIGNDVLQACRVDPLVLEILSQAQLRYSMDLNRGAATEIMQGARILIIADAYESLSSPQVYRQAKSHDEIMRILLEGAGTQFDGNVVHALQRWLNTNPPFGDLGPPGSATRDPRQAAVLEESLEATNVCNIFSTLSVLESLYDGFLILDANMHYRVWNHGVETLFGVPARDVLGQPWATQTLGYADERSRLLTVEECPAQQVVQSGRPYVTQLTVTEGRNAPLHLEVQALPLLDAGGELQGIAEIFRNRERIEPRKSQELRELKLAATRDALTRVANRGELESQLATQVQQFHSGVDPEPFSLIFVDADHFKSINDTYGHAVGDQVLIELARLLQAETYSGEVIGRYGGEEFVVLCPATDLALACRKAERFRTNIEKIRLPAHKDLSLTASFGVTSISPGDTIESLMGRADRALYKAKASGRNRTASVEPGETEACPKPSPAKPVESTGFRLTSEIHISVTNEVLLCKLKGYMRDSGARFIDATPDQVILRLGSRGWLGGWGRDPQRQGVYLTICNSPQPTRASLAASLGRGDQLLSVTVRPYGRVTDETTFLRRAHSVLKDLRAFLVAT